MSSEFSKQTVYDYRRERPNSETLAYIVSGTQNDYIKKFLKGNGYYTKKSSWMEEIKNEYMEDNLEKELEEFRTQIDNEQRDFEENLQFNKKIDGHDFIEEISSNTSLMNLITNKSVTSEINFTVNPTQQNNCQLFKIGRICDIIYNIYLEVKVPESFDGLTLQEKFALLHSDITLIIGGNIINKFNILTGLFMQICTGKKIIELEDTIQIPLFDFEIMSTKLSFEHYSKKQDFTLKGLPIINISVQSIDILLNTHEQLKNFSFRLMIKAGNIDTKPRSDLRAQFLEFLMIQNQEQITTKSITNIDLHFYHLSKCFILYFKPKSNNDFWDFLTDYPLIENVGLSLNKIPPIEYDSEEILDFEIFGIKIYLIPFTKDFATWEKIYECMKNPLENLEASGINFSRLDAISLCLNGSESSKNFDLIINCLNFNFLKICEGFAGKSFSN